MGLVDYLILGVLAATLLLAARYVYKAKKSGKKCIGCPDSCACSSGNCTGGCSGCSRR